MEETKIVWLASYLKSGNTWFRAFLSALANKGTVDINNMAYNSIFSSREIFYQETDIDSRYLYDSEVKNLQPDVFRQRALDAKRTVVVKVHDAFTYNEKGLPIIPQEVTNCAIYFIRNPLDIVGSLANHMGVSIERAAQVLVDKNNCFARQEGNLNIAQQFRQFTSDWSGHVTGWTTKPSFPVYVVRYEDMLEKPFDIFKRLLGCMEIGEFSDEEILAAVEACSFDRLKNQEAQKGFTEKFQQTPSFFRSGKAKSWEQELAPDLVNLISSSQHKLMKMYGY